MENGNITDTRLHSIFSGLPILKRLYDITINEADYLENANYVLKQVGNLASSFYLYTADAKDYKIPLPCNAYNIQWVSTKSIYRGGYEISTINVQPNHLINFEIKQVLDVWYDNILNKSILHPEGDLITYRIENGYLVVPIDGITLTVLYRGYVTDEKGFPKITEDEAFAIAHYCAFIHANKMTFMGHPNGGNMLQVTMPQYEKAVARARIHTYLSHNAINDILDAAVSWDRKLYGMDMRINP